ncbi:unnamed protein product [Ceratitis capitata]|uniref:(Mediterranean fruit fly) hypothetical protein n=1 Tax=Ceratitis capitata TaxID=7213 RepID=A0A811V7B1_CERCA|nr:unnamed protein product [Ceratitis capitata]
MPKSMLQMLKMRRIQTFDIEAKAWNEMLIFKLETNICTAVVKSMLLCDVNAGEHTIKPLLANMGEFNGPQLSYKKSSLMTSTKTTRNFLPLDLYENFKRKTLMLGTPRYYHPRNIGALDYIASKFCFGIGFHKELEIDASIG